MEIILSKFKQKLGFSKQGNIKEVLEDLIVDDENKDKRIDDGTKKIFKNVIDINDKCIEDIMIPRADIDAISENATFDDLVKFINKTKHSRIPIYQNNLDKVTGMIHIRDLFKRMNQNVKIDLKNKEIKKLCRKILFSSPSMKILDLLLKMRKNLLVPKNYFLKMI